MSDYDIPMGRIKKIHSSASPQLLQEYRDAAWDVVLIRKGLRDRTRRHPNLDDAFDRVKQISMTYENTTITINRTDHTITIKSIS